MSSNPTLLSDSLNLDWSSTSLNVRDILQNHTAEQITRAASKQTYYTIRFLVDRERIDHAYQTYAYFRWVDDWLDEQLTNQPERVAFVERQQAILGRCYRGERVHHLSTEEWMLVDLIRSDSEPDSGLRAYIRHMMAVMAFDAARRGQLVSARELDDYTLHLATAVTEAMHYFIGHGQFAPSGDNRYSAVIAAHITHMLRDTYDDVAAGYFNIPREFLEAHGIDAQDVNREAYRIWVKSRVELARSCFETGKSYLAQVENRRCRLAGYAYMARFQGVLDAIERENYQLRTEYLERKTLKGGLKIAGTTLSLLISGDL